MSDTNIIERHIWGATEPTRPYTDRGTSRACVIHHTAGEYVAAEEGKPGPKWYRMVQNGRASLAVRRAVAAFEKEKDTVEERERAAMRAIQRAHKANGWIDIGYHVVCFPSGRKYRGRPLHAWGAHCLNANDEIGFSFAGNYEVTRPTDKALKAWAEFRRVEVDAYKVRGHYRVPGNATACPGKFLKLALGL